MSLAALVKNRQKKSILTGLIDEHLMMADDADDRRDRMFHPSDLAGRFCPKAWALYNYHPEGMAVKVADIEPRLSRIFGNGHGVHYRMQRYLSDMGVLFGTWQRAVGVDAKGEVLVERHWGFKPDGAGWVYCEVALGHPDDRIAGSTDGIMRLHDKKYGLEVKSINSEGFKWLQDQPKEFHKNQTLLYMHCLEYTRQVNVKLAASGTAPISSFFLEPLHGFVVLYENKDTQELKEFFVPFDQVEIDQYMVGRRKLMKEALSYERDGTWPQCRCIPGKETALCAAFDAL